MSSDSSQGSSNAPAASSTTNTSQQADVVMADPGVSSAPAPPTTAAADSSADPSNGASNKKQRTEGGPTPSSTPAEDARRGQLAAMQTQLQRFIRQLTVGCGRSDCANPNCVSSGRIERHTRETVVPKARQLYLEHAQSCVPAAAMSSSSSSAAPVAEAPIPLMPSIGGSANPNPPATPAPAPRPTPAASATPATPASASAVMSTPIRPVSSSSLVAPGAPMAAAAPPRSTPLTVPRPVAPRRSTGGSAASGSAAASSSSPSFSPRPAPSASPTLAEMLASATPSLPVKSHELPIIDIAEWTRELDGAKAQWAASGSKPSDLTPFRPFVQRIYKVFNSIDCLNLSFRIMKDDDDRRADEKKLAELNAPAASTIAPSTGAGELDSSMTDVAASISTITSLAPTPAALAAAEVHARLNLESQFVEPTQFSPAFDYEQLGAFYESITSVAIPQSDGTEIQPILNSLLNGLRTMLNDNILRPMRSDAVHPATLRAVVAIIESPIWMDPSHYDELKLLCQFISNLPRAAKKLMTSWMVDTARWSDPPVKLTPAHARRLYSVERLENLLGALQQYISVRIYDKEDLRHVAPAVVFISILHDANEEFDLFARSIPLTVPMSDRSPMPLSPKLFYNDAINNEVDLKQDFRRWVTAIRSGQSGKQEFSFFKFNFVLDAGSKATLLRYDAAMQQHAQYREGVLQNGMNERAGYLILEVRRNEIVRDTMKSLASKSEGELKKPLKIHFSGEKGIDAGGLRKEFFQLIIGELFDPQYGMFLVDNETRTFKFNPDSLDAPLEFELIGKLLGISIYNSTILDLHLPRVTYKMLLGETPNLQDLIESQPDLGRGLQQLLDFDGDVEATFARDFTYSYESYGEMKVVELKADGANIPVTNANRVEFVQLYVDYVLSKSTKKQFGAFYKGFQAACGGDALRLFRPFELEQLICGSGDLDFDALESTTRYDDGFTKDSPTVKHFWEIVHQELSLEDKKRLLEFATGSDRVPIRGSKDKLREKLLRALQHTRGFGII